MGAVKSSEIMKPKRGQPVWMIVNGRPALRYFVEFYSGGCRVSIDAGLTNVYFDELAYFFRSEISILANFIEGALDASRRALDEADGYRQRLLELGTAVVCSDCWTVSELGKLKIRKRECHCPACGARLCRRCGCTEAAACDGGCWWSEGNPAVCDSHEAEGE